MSDINENNSDLDSYGVWVKKPPKDIQSESNNTDVPEDFDLPDFSDLDTTLPDIAEEGEAEKELNVNDSTENSKDDPFDMGDFSFPEVDEEAPLSSEELSDITETLKDSTDTVLSDDTSINESLDDFNVNEINADDGEAFLPEATQKQPVLKYNENGEVINDNTAATTDAASYVEPVLNDIDDFFNDDMTLTTDSDGFISNPETDKTVSQDASLEEISAPDVVETKEANNMPTEDVVPDFDTSAFDEAVAKDTTQSAEASSIPDFSVSSEETVATDSFDLSSQPDGEVSFDDFMSGDSSSGDIDLSDFLSDDMGGSSSSAPIEIEDEKTLDIDVSFDEKAEQELEAEAEKEKAEAKALAAKTEEEAIAEAAKSDASLDDDIDFSSLDNLNTDDMFAEGEAKSSTATTESSTDSSGESEVDLSEFGLDDDDSNMGMTKGPNDGMEEHKEVIDYDMKVTVDTDSNEKVSMDDVIKGHFSRSSQDALNDDSSSVQDSESQENITMQGAQGVSPEISEKGQEILDQIVSQLSELKSEIMNLKTDFEEIKTHGVPSGETASNSFAEIPPSEEESTQESSSSGFFDDDGGDDTIAISADEMNSIPTDEEPVIEETSEVPEDQTIVEEPSPEESLDDTPVVENSSGFFDDDGGDDTIAISTDEMNDIITTAEFEASSEDKEMASDDVSPESSDETISVDDTNPDETVLEQDDNLQMDFNTDNLEEPQVDSLEASPEDYREEEGAEDENLPNEISVPKADDIVVESSTSDLMDSVVNTDNLEEEPFEEPKSAELDDFIQEEEGEKVTDISLDDSIEEENAEGPAPISEIMSDNTTLQEGDEAVGITMNEDIDSAFAEAEEEEDNIYENSTQETEEGAEDEDYSIEDAVENIQASNLSDILPENTFKSTIEEQGDETVVDDNIEEPTVDDSLSEEPTLEETAVDVPPEQVQETEPNATSNLSPDLTTEIKSVLSYMDQLLESLPEDKISEFATSEHFVTYKKLFEELGLS